MITNSNWAYSGIRLGRGLQQVLLAGSLKNFWKTSDLGRPEPMIKFSSEAVANKVLKGLNLAEGRESY